jgi:hypothetical protein
VTNEDVKKLSASNLRVRLIVEIQDFIRSIEQNIAVEVLTKKRDNIKSIFHMLSEKEVTEFDELMGKYFPKVDNAYHPGATR